MADHGWGCTVGTSNTTTAGVWTTGSTFYPAVVSTGPITLAPTPAPKKRTPLEWLDDEIERICELTRGGLAA